MKWDFLLSQWLSMRKFSQAISWVKWLSSEKTNVLKTISVLILRVLVWLVNHLTWLVAWENFIILIGIIWKDVTWLNWIRIGSSDWILWLWWWTFIFYSQSMFCSNVSYFVMLCSYAETVIPLCFVYRNHQSCQPIDLIVDIPHYFNTWPSFIIVCARAWPCGSVASVIRTCTYVL